MATNQKIGLCDYLRTEWTVLASIFYYCARMEAKARIEFYHLDLSLIMIMITASLRRQQRLYTEDTVVPRGGCGSGSCFAAGRRAEIERPALARQLCLTLQTRQLKTNAG